MAAATDGIKIKQTDGRRAYRVKANEVIYVGGMVGIDSSGRAVSPTATTGLRIVGVAVPNSGRKGASNAKGDQVWDATGLSDGAFMVEVREGRFSFQNSGGGDAIAATDRRKVIYLQDNQTLALTSNSGARSPAGVCDGLDDDNLPVVILGLEMATLMSIQAGLDKITSLTDSTGGAANNTLAAITLPGALTNNAGGAAADGTIAAVTLSSALTDSTGGVANATLAAITQAANAGSADVAPVANALAQLAANANADRTAISSLRDAVMELAAKCDSANTALSVTRDCLADLAAKVNEILAV